MYNRKAWRDLRLLALERDNNRCVKCGISGDIARLEIDHIIERKDGGADIPPLSMVQTLCMSCHQLKTNREKEWRNGQAKESIIGVSEDLQAA